MPYLEKQIETFPFAAFLGGDTSKVKCYCTINVNLAEKWRRDNNLYLYLNWPLQQLPNRHCHFPISTVCVKKVIKCMKCFLTVEHPHGGAVRSN